jgi:amidase
LSISPPSREQLAELAESLGLDLSDERLDAYEALAAGAVAAYATVDRLSTPTEPRAMEWWLPEPADDPYDAFTWRCSIRETDDGPLAGRTVAVKDNIAVAGLPLGNGSPLLDGYVSATDATIVRRVLEAGGEIVGKTVVPAFCFDGSGITGYPKVPRNPYAPGHLPGGSSSGSAVAVAAGQVDLALGTDQGGSIRMPASWSGCVGLKPTYGLVPYTGIVDMERTFDHAGPLAATVAGCALLLDVIAGPDGMDSRQEGVPAKSYGAVLERGLDGASLAILREGFAWPGLSERDVDDAVLSAAGVLERAGAHVSERSVPLHRDAAAIWSVIASGCLHQMLVTDGMGSNHRGRYEPELADFIGRTKRERSSQLADTVALSFLIAEHVSRVATQSHYARAQNLALALRDAYDAALADCDALLLPTTPLKATGAPEHATVAETVHSAFGVLHNTAPFNVSGHPAISVPCAVSNGLPVGLMLVGRMHDEPTLLRLAHAFEQLRGPLAKETA